MNNANNVTTLYEFVLPLAHLMRAKIQNKVALIVDVCDVFDAAEADAVSPACNFSFVFAGSTLLGSSCGETVQKTGSKSTQGMYFIDKVKQISNDSY